MGVKFLKGNIYLKSYLIICLTSILILIGVGFIMKSFFYESKIQSYKTKAEQVLAGIAYNIDVDKIIKYKSSLKMDDEYKDVVRDLDRLNDTVDAKNLFVASPFDNENNIYIYDTTDYGDGVEDSVLGRCLLGSKFPVDDWSSEIFSGKEDYKKSDVYDQNSKWGHVCTAVKSLKDNNGNVVAFVGIDYDMNNEVKNINKGIIRFLIDLFVAFVIFLTLEIIILQYFIISPIKLISSAVRNLINKKHNKIILTNIKVKNRNDDIAMLANTFNKMESDLQKYTENIKKISAEKEQIATELNIANRIQSSLIPHTFPAFPELKEIDIYANSKSAKKVGGDFYDFFLVDNSHIAFAIADVSGKGISAALFMVIARTLIRNETSIDKTTGEILEHVNNQMCVENDLGMFLTLFFGILNFKTGELHFSNAGHLKPIIKSKFRKFKELDVKKNFVIAGMPNLKFKNEKIQLTKDDIIFMYTDGITESLNEESQTWGIENLIDTLNTIDTSTCPPKNIVKTVKEKLNEFSKGQVDDETILIIKYQGS